MLLLALLSFATATAVTSKAKSDTVREKVNFDFGWRHRLGPVPGKGTATSFAAGAVDDLDPPFAGFSYDDSGWVKVDAPHDMLLRQAFDESNEPSQAFLPRNEGWYRKHFSLPLDWKESAVWFYTEGIFHVTTAWLNGRKIGVHNAGYTSFSLRLDNVTGVAWGDNHHNVLALHVNATFGTGWWYEGGGLSRHQYLIKTNKDLSLGPPNAGGVFAHVPPSDLQIDDSDGKHMHASSAVLEVQATIMNYNKKLGSVTNQIKKDAREKASSSVSARLTLLKANGEQAAPTVTTLPLQPPTPMDSLVFRAAIKAENVQLWSVKTPHLYTLVTDIMQDTCVIDSVRTSSIGFRSINFTADRGMFLNNQHVKIRGFCDHSNFGGVGSAVPDRVNLYRAQMLRSVGGNSWRMAHNPPIPARLDFTDALGILVLDENRDYGGAKQQGGISRETVQEQIQDMGDLVIRDRNRASVMAWSFCNEGGCANESSAKPFREETYKFDGTRPVTQNRHATDLSTRYLDVQGFSHKKPEDFDEFHKMYPKKPTLATECCSCLSQRGVDEDECPNPRPSGCLEGCRIDCHGNYTGNHTDGMFYNNEISQCTAVQVNYTDSRSFVSGTFIWSAFDYLGEARGWPQVVKPRGAVADVAGFYKESSQWIKAWWLSAIPAEDAGRPNIDTDIKYSVYVPETWQPVSSAKAHETRNRTIHIYSNAPFTSILLNGKRIATQPMPFFGTTEFNLRYQPGNLTAQGLDENGNVLAVHSVFTPGIPSRIRLLVDAPSPLTGTGESLLADGEDVAMLRAEIVDASGNLVSGFNAKVTFTVISGEGMVLGVHSGSVASHTPVGSYSEYAYHGLVRAYIRSTIDRSTSIQHRIRMKQIDKDTALSRVVIEESDFSSSIIVEATSEGLSKGRVEIPVTTNLMESPKEVARREGMKDK